MTVLLDTNIVASATFWRGKPAHCLEAWLLGKFSPLAGPARKPCLIQDRRRPMRWCRRRNCGSNSPERERKGVNRRFELELRAWFCGGCGGVRYSFVWRMHPMMEHGLGALGSAYLNAGRNPFDRQGGFTPKRSSWRSPRSMTW
jgi:hypothetical protein